jgi:hypothetical protein
MKPEIQDIQDETVKAIVSAFERIDRLCQQSHEPQSCIAEIQKILADTTMSRMESISVENQIRHILEPKSTHKPGEPFVGSVCGFDTGKIKPGEHLEYAGEISEVGDNKPYQWSDVNGIAVYGWDEMPRELLRLVPDEPAPKFKVGAWAVTPDNIPHVINDISDVTGNCCFLEEYGWCSESRLKPAVKSDFVFTVDGNRMIVFVDNNGFLFMHNETGSSCFMPSQSAHSAFILALAYIREHNITPCPPEVHQGDMTLPKEDKL